MKIFYETWLYSFFFEFIFIQLNCKFIEKASFIKKAFKLNLKKKISFNLEKKFCEVKNIYYSKLSIKMKIVQHDKEFLIRNQTNVKELLMYARERNQRKITQEHKSTSWIISGKIGIFSPTGIYRSHLNFNVKPRKCEQCAIILLHGIEEIFKNLRLRIIKKTAEIMTCGNAFLFFIIP